MAVGAATSSVVPDPQDPIWGGVFTRFNDVDGNSFELVGFDEVSREIEAQRHANAEKIHGLKRLWLEMLKQFVGVFHGREYAFGHAIMY